MQEIMLSNIYNMPDDQMGTMSLLGIDKAQVNDNSFSVIMEVGDIHLNTQGFVHGGILYTLCDQVVGAYIAFKKMKGVGMDGRLDLIS